jgi:monoamine oxidase
MENTLFNADIIIVGAGIAGLVAAAELGQAGKKVLILEAKEQAGGRIATFHDPAFGEPIELGAEFIHGNLEHTFQLIKKYKLDYQPVRSDFRQEKNGELLKDQDPIEDSGELEKKLKEVEEDITVNAFLEKNFPQNELIKRSVRKFVEGYDAADPEYASALGLKDEWMNENWEQYKMKGGYEKLISALLNTIFENGGKLITSQPVTEINWDKEVKIITSQNTYFAKQVLVTVPLGILQAGTINFIPDIPEKKEAAQKLGYGSVIKFVLRFDEPIWEQTKALKKPVFIISQQAIPTWWTHEQHKPLITGWLGGPDAKKLSAQTDAALLEIALTSLSAIFKTQVEDLKIRLKGWKVANWQTDEFSLGAYTYSTVNAEKHINMIKEPLKNMLFFAGEALEKEAGIGTVEAAIASGIQVSATMLNK